MKAYRVYLHPRTWRRRTTLFYHRYLVGRSRGENLSPVEKQLMKQFYNLVHDPNTKLEHYVNGVFAKELVRINDEGMARFRLVDNNTKVFYLKQSENNKIVIETYVSAKTILVLNRLFDKEFARMMHSKKETENQMVRDIFGDI